MTTTETTKSSAGGQEAAHPPTTGPLIVATSGAGAMPVITAARLIAPRLGAAPEIFAVSEPIAMYLPDISMASIIPDLEADQRTALLDEVTRVTRASEGNASSWPIDVTVGQPARAIARRARDRKARMIIMGLGRHQPMDRVFGSETALLTIRHANRPVLAVAPDFDKLPHHAAIAVDFSAASVRAAEEALALIGPGGTLSLVHVKPADDILQRVGDRSVRENYDEDVASLFDRLIGSLTAPESVTVKCVVLEGNPADQMVQFSEDQQVDLIASGSSGLGLLERLMVGSVATRIIRRSMVSVLVVPRPSSAEVERIEHLLSAVGEASREASWPALLEEFSERNEGRSTQLEMDNPSFGAQFQGTGYKLVGVAYDRRDAQLYFMLGAPTGSGAHLTHAIPDVTSVTVLTDSEKRDLALQVRHGEGQTILTFKD